MDGSFIPLFGRFFALLFPVILLHLPGFPRLQSVGEDHPLVPAVLVEQGGERVLLVIPAVPREICVQNLGEVGAQRGAETRSARIGRAEQTSEQRVDLLEQRRELEKRGILGTKQREGPRGQREEELK